MKYALVLACCAACGRLGFDASSHPGDEGGGEPGDDGGGGTPGRVTVRVLGLAMLPDNGQPAPGVPVVFDGPGGQMTETSAADGFASVATDGPTDVHVLRAVDTTTWMMTSFYAIDPGALVIAGGDGIDQVQDHTTLTVPVDPTSSGYTAISVDRCIVEGDSSSATFSVAFSRSCTGQNVPMYARARGGNQELWQQTSGPLVDGGSLSATGAWQPTTPRIITFTNVPDGTGVDTELVAEVGTDTLRVGDASFTSDGGAMGLTIPAFGPAPTHALTLFISPGETVVAVVWDAFPLPGDAFDANRVPAPLAGMHTDAPERFAWSLPAQSPYALAISDATLAVPGGATVVWRAYAPATSLGYTYPSLPDSLAAARAGAGTTSSSISFGAFVLPNGYAAGVHRLDQLLTGTSPEDAFAPGSMLVGFNTP